MAKITYREFIPEDAYSISLRAHEEGLLNRPWLCTIPEFENSGVWTFFYEGEILAIVGFFQKWPGVAQTFVIPSIFAKRCPQQFVRSIRRHIQNMQKVLNYHRIQTESWANENTDKWMKLLGFHCEGTLHKFSANGDDYRMWAILPHKED